jgi:uracil-DNA glycosylase
MTERLGELLAAIRAPCGSDCFNPWTDTDAGSDPASQDAPAGRLARLRAHLDCDARLVLVGEAAGYQGCHVSGIAFTSERLILEGAIPRVHASARLSTRARPWSEPSATTVWGTLHELGLAESTVLWNCFPWHPHRPGVLQSNRTPTKSELAQGARILQLLLALHPRARVVAVGRLAHAGLASLGCAAPCVRHPSMGGATAFREGLRELGSRERRHARIIP